MVGVGVFNVFKQFVDKDSIFENVSLVQVVSIPTVNLDVLILQFVFHRSLSEEEK